MGIFQRNQRPIFSLHFNSDGSLYPVIPPDYANTTVGRVMGLLDYHMKAFLNGGAFDESFIDTWLANGAGSTQNAAGKMIDLRSYIAEHVGSGLPYYSMRELMAKAGIDSNDHTRKIRTSFRIIADNPIRGANGGYVVGTGFRVEYTIDAGPAYAEAQARHRRDTGADSAEHTQLVAAHEAMAQLIQEIMPQMPMCRDMFNMLGVVHFFSYYFESLKERQRVPLLPIGDTVSGAALSQAAPPAAYPRTAHGQQHVARGGVHRSPVDAGRAGHRSCRGVGRQVGGRRGGRAVGDLRRYSLMHATSIHGGRGDAGGSAGATD